MPLLLAWGHPLSGSVGQDMNVRGSLKSLESHAEVGVGAFFGEWASLAYVRFSGALLPPLSRSKSHQDAVTSVHSMPLRHVYLLRAIQNVVVSVFPPSHSSSAGQVL